MIDTDERKRIHDWCTYNSIRDFTISDEGVVDVHSEDMTSVLDVDTEKLPVKFGLVNGSMKVTGELSSLEGFPHTVKGSITIHATKITNLHDVHKIIKHIGGTFVCPSDITHVLGLLLIDGLKIHDSHPPVDSDRGVVDEVIIRYVGTRDVVSAMEDLLAAGLKEQARL